ncbi:hypothetical protein Hanom_Chr08g00698371 [Helianthus anomalus]
MYPLFLQMIMNVQHPNLPKADNDILKIDSMIEQSLRIFRGLAIKRYTESEPPRKLFGALGKPDYIAHVIGASSLVTKVVMQVLVIRRIRREDDDAEYVPSDTEAERLKKKQTVVRRKKKEKKNISSSSVQQSVPQQEPTQEAEMDPNLGFTAAEATDMVPPPPRSSEPAPVVSSTPETPTVTPQAPAHSIASTIRAITSQLTAECRHTIFSQMQPNEKAF